MKMANQHFPSSSSSLFIREKDVHNTLISAGWDEPLMVDLEKQEKSMIQLPLFPIPTILSKYIFACCWNRIQKSIFGFSPEMEEPREGEEWGLSQKAKRRRDLRKKGAEEGQKELFAHLPRNPLDSEQIACSNFYRAVSHVHPLWCSD